MTQKREWVMDFDIQTSQLGLDGEQMDEIREFMRQVEDFAHKQGYHEGFKKACDSMRKMDDFRKRFRFDNITSAHKEDRERTLQEVIEMVKEYWKFDSSQQPTTSWHDKQELIGQLTKMKEEL